MKFARCVFGIAALSGILVLVPMYFLLEKTGIDNPPAVTHPEFYYGFVGVALAFQFVFIIIAADPFRFRPVMIAAVIEKFSWGLPVLLLHFGGRVTGPLVFAACLDLSLGILFAVSYFVTKQASFHPRSARMAIFRWERHSKGIYTSDKAVQAASEADRERFGPPYGALRDQEMR